MAKTNKGFTLAEVLITLVIIGIIAAITVPVIMQNHKRIETAAKLKKFYSTLSNAVKLAENEWGIPSYDWGADVNTSDYDIAKNTLEKYFLKYLSYQKVDKLSNNVQYYSAVESFPFLSNSSPLVYLNDGSLLFFIEVIDNPIYDVNGEKGPNKWGRDIFPFYILLGNDDTTENSLIYTEGFAHVNTISWNNVTPTELKTYTRDKLISNCSKNTALTTTCTYLVQIDGWEFKDDYPYRL